MGLKGLATFLRQFASREPLRGRVVIDGPALAYHILRLARSLSVSNVVNQPSYALLGATATQWLDALHSHGLEVAAIYFDGSLPPLKREERHRRLIKRSSNAQQWFLKTSSGAQPDTALQARFQPDPPFLVPAILETLRSLERYRHLSSLVPGEADVYCADDVKQNGGTLLTSDSDLLLYDLGPTGCVVFLHDLSLSTGDEIPDGDGGYVMSALTFKQNELLQRMSLGPDHVNMLQFGFEMKMRPCRNARVLAKQSEWLYLDEAYADKYAEFIAEYQRPLGSMPTVLAHRTPLDPRVSELILGSPSTTQNLTVWLPLLVDRWDRTSSWDLSTPIRQLAYSLYHSSASPNSSVTEYRRTLSQTSVGQAVALLHGPEALGTAGGLVVYLDQFVADPTKARILQWITTCLSLEISHAAQVGRQSNALSLWRTAAASKGRLNAASWDAVHLAAQIMGALYSFRVLQQVLAVLKACWVPGAEWSDAMDRLEQRLSSLPTIAEFPTAMDMEDLFEQLHEKELLTVLTEVAEVAEIPFKAAGESAEGVKGKAKQVETEAPKRPKAKASLSQASSNPFELLSMAN